MSTLGNLLWLIFGGLLVALGWYLAGILMIISIIGIPWARACFVIAKFSLCPFGRELISRSELHGKEDVGTGVLGVLGNIVWFIFAGWWLALSHLIVAVPLAVSIIGIPFAWQHVKLAAISLAPIGKTVVRTGVAEAAFIRNAQARLDS